MQAKSHVVSGGGRSASPGPPVETAGPIGCVVVTASRTSARFFVLQSTFEGFGHRPRLVEARDACLVEDRLLGAQRFGEEIVGAAADLSQSNAPHRIVVVAPPEVLRCLRLSLARHTRGRDHVEVVELERDLSWMDERELTDVLASEQILPVPVVTPAPPLLVPESTQIPGAASERDRQSREHRMTMLTDPPTSGGS